MKKYILSLFLCFISWTFSALCQPNITITPTTVSYGNSVKIIFSDNKPIESLPDLSELQKYFMIRGQNQSAQTRIFNGVKTAEYQLELTVFPRKSGTFDIGPFQWRNENFSAQTVNVTDSTVGIGQEQEINSQKSNNVSTEQMPKNAVFKLETFVDEDSLYIGETTLYKIRLLDNIGLTQARVEPPLSDDYTLTPYGKDQLGVTTIDGERVQLYERAFLLTPKKTGLVIIPEASVVGSIPDTSAQSRRYFGGSMFPDMFDNDPFFNMALGVPQKEVYKQSSPIRLTVKEKPADWTGWWLPAKEVSLTENYKTTTNLRVGEPIERHIQLSVAGVEGHQLPLLTQAVTDGFKVYANPEKRSQIAMNNTIWGYEEITFVIVPTKSGVINVPPIQIEWFNTKTGQKETTTLSGRSFTILPAENVISGNIENPLNTDKPDLSFKQSDSDNFSETLTETEKSTEQSQFSKKEIQKTEEKSIFNSVWFFILSGAGILIALLLGVLGYWLGSRKQIKTLAQKGQKEHKRKQKKKPIPDLYPF